MSITCNHIPNNWNPYDQTAFTNWLRMIYEDRKGTPQLVKTTIILN